MKADVRYVRAKTRPITRRRMPPDMNTWGLEEGTRVRTGEGG